MKKDNVVDLVKRYKKNGMDNHSAFTHAMLDTETKIDMSDKKTVEKLQHLLFT